MTKSLAALLIATSANAATALDYQAEVEPVLVEFCYDCHGDGSDKGQVALDELSVTNSEHQDVWHRVLRNVRAELMPPEGKAQPSAHQRRLLEQWIKQRILQLDPKNPDPGPAQFRRLNRTEYRNTIRDLMGIDFAAEVEFPPDDTGYGFDNIGSVLTLSPLLSEKYLEAAESIVREAVPLQERIPAQQVFRGYDLTESNSGENGSRIPFSAPRTVQRKFNVESDGTYRIHFRTEVDGAFNFDPGRALVTFEIDDTVVMATEHSWRPSDKYVDLFVRDWSKGPHSIAIHLKPTHPIEDDQRQIYLEIHEIKIEGPMAETDWVRPPRFERFFSGNETPDSTEARDRYADEIIKQFADKAFRGRTPPKTLERLGALARHTYRDPTKSLQEGVARAFVAILASPRFLLLRSEPEMPSAKDGYPFIDQLGLASRLSYFLWSSMPDDELLHLGRTNQLRDQLEHQVERMLADPKADAFIESFVGQWLQARDIDRASINARAVLARETAEDPEVAQLRERFFTLIRRPRESLNEAELAELAEIRKQRSRIFRRPRNELTGSLRRAMRQETEAYFRYVVQKNRPIVELLDSNYTFLNDTLAKHYGIPDVTGSEMRRVTLAPDTPRGGVLTQGTALIVTSNPTRTSPVKRGLFILENILGTPPPPPPADVPDLEEAKSEGREPTLREALAIHRESPLCRSCHNRMDPLGLSLENFNALGIWREQEYQQPIDAHGKLITGESFETISELKTILATERKVDFYRCLTEKLLTYALGRGLEPFDVETVDQIVADLEKDDRFTTLLKGVVFSAPFLKTRTPENGLNRSLALSEDPFPKP